jgi:hypothetical protein
MFSGIRMQVRILILVMMMIMLNPPRRVLPALSSRKLYLYLTHLIVLWQKVNRRYAKLMNLPMMILFRW